MERRKFLIGAAGAAVGSSALIGSGAFTSVSAQRALDVHTPTDSDSLLGLQATDSPNGQYVSGDGSVGDTWVDSISIDLGGDGTVTESGGYGPNDDAITVIRNLFHVTNMGTQEVQVWADGLPDWIIMFYEGEESVGPFSDLSDFDPSNLASVLQDSGLDTEGLPQPSEGRPTLDVGDQLTVGILLDTHEGGSFHDDIVINAVAEGVEAPQETPPQ